MLGVAVYTVVESFVFPNAARDSFKEDLRRQAGHIRKALPYLVAGFKGEAREEAERAEARAMRKAAIELQGMLTGRLDGATIESFDMLERRGAWRRAVIELGALIEGLDRWRLGFADLSGGGRDLDIDAVFAEIARRLEEAGALLAGAERMEGPRPVETPERRHAPGGGDPFAEGALAASLDAVREIERASRALLVAVAEGQGLEAPPAEERRRPAPPRSIVPDPERIAIAARAAATFLIGFGVFVFLPDFPATTMVTMQATITVIVFAKTPTANLGLVGLIGVAMLFIGGCLHVFVMPHLSSYLGLGALIFVYTFLVVVAFHMPELAAARTLGLGMGVIAMQIENRQTYDFLYVADISVGFVASFAVLWLTGIFPVSFRAEHVFRRLLRRYLRSCEAVLQGAMRADGAPRGWRRRQALAYRLEQIRCLPRKLASWLGRIPAGAMDEEGRKRAAEFLEALRDAPERLAAGDAARARDDMRGLAEGARAYLEGAPEPQDPAVERALAALRGVSEAIEDLLRPAAGVDWLRLREARF